MRISDWSSDVCSSDLKLLLDRGELQRGQASMQGILDYLRADPVRGAAVMNENPSWVFFRELTGPGPLGALGVPVTGRTSVAADPKYVPPGAPVVLSLDRAAQIGRAACRERVCQYG